MINHQVIVAMVKDTLRPFQAKGFPNLHLMARTHLKSENPRRWMGQALRFAPFLSAYTRKARGGPIQTIAPAFDGLKVFPSLKGF
jgi:hypothetical protein